MSRTKKTLEVKRNPTHSSPVRGLKTPEGTRVEWRTTAYAVGDGDHTVYIPRPGSDHSHIKSFSSGT